MNELRTPGRLERQMKEAHQLRAETLASGCASAIDGLSGVVRALRPTRAQTQPDTRSEPYFGRTEAAI